MLDILFPLLLGGGLVAGLIWLKGKLEEREAQLSSGEEIGRLQPYTDGIMKKLEGEIDVKQPDLWYRMLMLIDMEEIIEGRTHSFPEKYNYYSIAISNERGRTVYKESGTLRPFVLNLRHAHRKEPSGVRRERNIFSRMGQVIFLEFAPQAPGRYQIECEFQGVLEAKSEKFNFRSVINNLEITIMEDIIPISNRGEHHHKIVKLKR